MTGEELLADLGIGRIAFRRELGELADQVAEQVRSGALGAASVRRRLSPVRVAAAAEVEQAERQARLMDAHGDDAGAMVRRLVARTHVEALVEAALRSLLPGIP